MTSKVLLAKHGKTFKIWGFDLFANREEGTATLHTYWGRIGLRMDQLTKKTEEGELYTLWAKAENRWIDKAGGEYTPVPNHRYFDLVHRFHEDIDNLIDESKGVW